MKTKKQWLSPNLLTHGSIEAITEQLQDKDFGSSDGFSFQGNAIKDNP